MMLELKLWEHVLIPLQCVQVAETRLKWVAQIQPSYFQRIQVFVGHRVRVVPAQVRDPLGRPTHVVFTRNGD